MSMIFPINPNAGGPDGDRPDPVMPDLDPREQENSEDTPDGALRAGGTEEEGQEGLTADDLPYSWSELDETEAQQAEQS
jgi:hypothetical protein